MKKFLASALSAALLLSALAGCSGSGSGSASGTASAGSGTSDGDKVIKIGVFEPASGDSASGGKKEMLGMQFANSESPTVELGGETYQVELVYADNGSSTDKAPLRRLPTGQRGCKHRSGFLWLRCVHRRRPYLP